MDIGFEFFRSKCTNLNLKKKIVCNLFFVTVIAQHSELSTPDFSNFLN